jgi:4-aminobutyrate aminotransferase-like enzyme
MNLSDIKSFNFPSDYTKDKYYKIPPPYCYRCPLKKKKETCDIECASYIEDTIKEHSDIGVFFIEPVIGSGGVIIIPVEYLKRAKEICKNHNVTFVFDEVITGFGRLGALTAMELYDITPDAVAFAKGMGAGIIPIGATLFNKELSEAISESEDISATFAWTPLACAVAKANIDILTNEKLQEKAKVKGEYLLINLNYLFNKYIPYRTGEIRGVGMLIGIELVNNLKEKKHDIRLMQRLSLGMVRNGLMVCESWNFETIFICPPLNISNNQIDAALNIIENELKIYSQSKSGRSHTTIN